MSALIPGNQKHLTLKNRIYIEDALNQGLAFKEIAGDQSTEIIKSMQDTGPAL